MKRIALVAGALFALALTVVAQPLVVQNLIGNEILQASTTPGGTGFFTSVNALRNATGYTLVATGTTVNTTVPATASRVIATGAITTWNVTLPVAPYDGQMVEVACPGGAATVAMTATAPAGVTIVGTAFTACTAGGAGANTAEWIYSTSANVWYRIQ